MDKEKEIKLIEEMQAIVAQMKESDIEDNPDSADEMFTCDSCGEEKIIAGSIPYKNYLLCNDCVLYAEIGFALEKIKTVDDLISMMEDKRLNDMCSFITEDQTRLNN